MTDTTTASDAAILAALECIRAGHLEMDSKSIEWHQDDANADELKAIWERIDKAERSILEAVATTPAGAAAQVWLVLSHSLTDREQVTAIDRGDLDYFIPEVEVGIDLPDRLALAALRSLKAMEARQ